MGAVALALPSAQLFASTAAQQPPTTSSFPFSDYNAQIHLIDTIKSYCRKEINMQLGAYFYTQWEIQQGMLHFVYVSEADCVNVPTGMRDFMYFGTDAKAAWLAADNLQAKGLHTMVYLSAGTSATRLNETLMSYPMDAIALIVFHEALHVHFRLKGVKIPLAIEEAASDVLSRYVTRDFQKSTKSISRKDLKRTTRIMEYIYRVINKSIEDLVCHSTQQTIIYNKCYKKIQRALRKSNNYQKKRFSYAVNNAFLIRNSFYSQYYFLLKDLYKRLDKSPTKFIDFVGQLPNDLNEALNIIEARCA